MPAPDAELALVAREKPRLNVIADAALNAEARAENLDAPLTPLDSFFVRNNGLTPETADAADWTLTVDGEVERPRRFTLDELKSEFENVTMAAVIECAGNGRFAFAPQTDGLQLSNGAVACGR